MCINDLIVQGAKPLFFLDYIALGKVKNKQYKEIIQGIYKGCKLSNCYLAGGETAEMPGIYLRDKFDLAGFAVGIVNKKKIVDGSKIQNNDGSWTIMFLGTRLEISVKKWKLKGK